MNICYKKLTSRRGDTLIEVLVSILLAVLCVVLLTGMIATATKFNQQAREADAQLYEQLSAAEGRTQVVDDSTNLQLSVGGTTYSVDISIYGTQDGLISYGKRGVGP